MTRVIHKNVGFSPANDLKAFVPKKVFLCTQICSSKSRGGPSISTAMDSHVKIIIGSVIRDVIIVKISLLKNM